MSGICLKCGHHDLDQWRNSRFDWNAVYMRFDEAQQIPELSLATKALANPTKNFTPFVWGPYTYYRRGTGGIWLYRVKNEDFKMPRERKKH